MMMANEEATDHEHHQLNNRRFEYDVYLSFRGSDTRVRFTGNLFDALRRKRIKVFMDEGGIKSGDQIAVTLSKALEGSRILLVVLSENYGSISWCLLELEKILECKKTRNQLVLPIFYGVDPSEVRRQTGGFGRAMYKLEERFGGDSERVQKWKSALSEVACISGFHFKTGYFN